jgi:DNA-binding NarL/FixJ family response regulator
MLNGLRLMLDEPDIEIVGQAQTGRDAVAQVLSLDPQVLILDVRLLDMNGLEVMKRIKGGSPQTAVILFTAFEEPAFLLGGVMGGAAGFLIKTAQPAEILALVRRVATGEDCLPRGYWEPLLRQLQAQIAPEAIVATEGWTPRELELLQLLAMGKKNREIADTLGISEDTVGFHTNKIFKRLGTSDRTQAVVLAIRRRLISIPDIQADLNG